jgi:hypothetical protein
MDFDLNKLGPSAPELASCGAAWATEGKWHEWSLPHDGSPGTHREFTAPVAPSVSIQSLTGPDGVISSGIYLEGTCTEGHDHRYLLKDGGWEALPLTPMRKGTWSEDGWSFKYDADEKQEVE